MIDQPSDSRDRRSRQDDMETLTQEVTRLVGTSGNLATALADLQGIQQRQIDLETSIKAKADVKVMDEKARKGMLRTIALAAVVFVAIVFGIAGSVNASDSRNSLRRDTDQVQTQRLQTLIVANQKCLADNKGHADERTFLQELAAETTPKVAASVNRYLAVFPPDVDCMIYSKQVKALMAEGH